MGVVGRDIGTMGMVGVDMTDITATATEDIMKEDKIRLLTMSLFALLAGRLWHYYVSPDVSFINAQSSSASRLRSTLAFENAFLAE